VFMPSVKQAVILAGGRGKRLAPITDSLPKPMVDVNGEPFLAHLMRLVTNQGITQVSVLTGYRGDTSLTCSLPNTLW
jgi:mannose-1-phosphate guanylyltransferase/phosphomannomutase